MGYHIRKIKRGTFGQISKIREEYEEFCDAVDQSNPVMKLVELSDLIGAIEAYVEQRHNITLEDLIRMKNATKSAFEDGTRTSNNEIKWKCRRCRQIVDMVAFRCGCTESPSPWEPVKE
jgi:hypothetical protein